jgi:WhiB family redox-sensing transcriptional regulator
LARGRKKRKEKVRRKNQAEREGSEMANVLFSDLLVPGWADTKIGLKEVTGTFGDRHAYSLPCHNANPETFFSEEKTVIEQAKRLCAPCPVRNECLKGALSRQEPCGVWGGELFHEGRVIAERRGVGRPRLVRVG